MAQRRHSAFGVLALAALTALARAIVLNQYQYCVVYFGSVTADLTLPEQAVPDLNYNGTIPCPRSWDFAREAGATLRLCPPSSALWYDEHTDGMAVEATLSLRGQVAVQLDLPVDALRLRNILVTNGSTPGPFTKGGVPAVLARDAGRSSAVATTWAIQGTERALIDTGDRPGVYFSCLHMSRDQRGAKYCGVGQDASQGGCFTEQTFRWGLDRANSLNFTIRFSPVEAEVVIATSNQYNGSAFNSTANLMFSGKTDLPGVADDDFWGNSETSYEVYADEANDILLVPDDKGMPVFQNMTRSAEWYAAGNQTYSTKNTAGRLTGQVPVWVATGIALSFVASHML
jgi:hypothetical protein